MENEVEIYYPADDREEAIFRLINAEATHFADMLQVRHRKFATYLKYYLNKKQRKRPKGMANIPVPLATQNVDIITADMADKQFGPEGVLIDTLGREQMDQDAADAHRDLIRYQFYETKASKSWHLINWQTAVFGTGPFKIAYTEFIKKISRHVPVVVPGTQIPIPGEYKLETGRETVYSGPIIIPVDIFDYFPHPDKLDDDDDLSTIHRFYASRPHLEKMQYAGIYKNVDHIDYEKEYGAAEYDPAAQHKRERKDFLGINTGAEERSGVLCYERQGLFKDDDGDLVLHTQCCTSGGVVLLDEVNPLEMSLFLSQRVYPIEGEYWGHGIVEKDRPNIQAANRILQDMLDALKMNIHRMMIADKRVDNRELLNRPGGIVHVDLDSDRRTVNDYVGFIQPGTIPPDAWNMYNMCRENSQNLSGATDIKMGNLPNSKQTARAISEAQSQSGIRFKAFLRMCEITGLEPACDRFQMINQLTMDQEQVVRIIGRNGLKWRRISPVDIAGRVNFIALGSFREWSRSVKTQQLMQAIEVLGKVPQGQAAVLPVIVALLEEMEIQNLEYVKDLLGWGQLEQQLLMQQAQQQMGAGGGNQQQAMMGAGPSVQNQPAVRSEQDLYDLTMRQNNPGYSQLAAVS